MPCPHHDLYITRINMSGTLFRRPERAGALTRAAADAWD
jgi:hypothetical protein